MNAVPEGPARPTVDDVSDARRPRVFVCVKWVATRVDVDPLDGTVHERPHDARLSQADLAAVETALVLSEAWTAAAGATGQRAGGTPEVDVPARGVTALCVGPVEADDALRDLLAVGVAAAIRIDVGSAPGYGNQPPSSEVAMALGDVISSLVDDPGEMLVVCGDLSVDRGSGSVPAYLAHRLGCAQALGLVDLSAGPAGSLACVRRLDGGRREQLQVDTPAVISVEGGVADLRRAPLAAMLASRGAIVDVRRGRATGHRDAAVLRPWSPRSRVIAAPSEGDALGRILELTGARTDRTPPRTVSAEPAEAARMILMQLREWGYEWEADSPS